MDMEGLKASLRDADICGNCGACMSFCQWDTFERQNPGKRGEPAICRSCMVCFRICPRPQSRYAQNEVAIFGAARQSDLLGYYTDALAARAVDRSAGAQDGGATTALLKFVLREAVVEAALLTRRDSAWRPQPFLATTEAEVDEAAGSKYTTSPALSLLKPALEQFDRLAFVGVPCQIAALRNLQQRREEAYPANKVVLAIGLFCAESFTYGRPDSYGMANFLQEELGMPIERVTRFDIKKNNLLVFEGEKVEGRPLADIKHLAWPICHACPDFTAELADLSTGAVGSAVDQSTILVRSAAGREVLDRAVAAGFLEVAPVRSLGILERIAQNKRTRRAELSPEATQFLTKRSIRGNFKKASILT